MRGEGNHKIPGSFAPENMEKTGADRVKYSLACQHEDAISIKFVSYAQKCPTVLCTFAVALRKESVDRNRRYPARCVVLLSSLSARRAWIEIASCWRVSRRPLSLSARRAWIEICYLDNIEINEASLSARRAWIEIPAGCWRDARRAVALRKESVDRNYRVGNIPLHIIVALRKESVDRNILPHGYIVRLYRSLSARRAWIEISVKDLNAHLYYRRSPQGERG